MSKRDFETLLNKQSISTKQEKINWDKQKKEWIEFIHIFYSSVEKWIKPFKDNGQLNYEFEDLVLTEDYIGSYQTNMMIINFFNNRIKIKPIGTLLIGTKGRIDMEGLKGSVQFILADKPKKEMKFSYTVTTVDGTPKKIDPDAGKPIDWTWKIVVRNSRKIAFDDFDEDNFFNALLEVSNG